MRHISIPYACLVICFSFQLLSAFPLQSSALTYGDLDVLKALLHQLEQSVPQQKDNFPLLDRLTEANFEDTALTGEESDAELYTRAKPVDERVFLSAKDLRTVRNDSSKRSSACFGRRMDRIGSMSTLGCNTAGRFSKSKEEMRSYLDPRAAMSLPRLL
ncbi:natriuretic peptides B [Chanos chanos]|uniref:Natriuretic peptides B n=1 Tax=Chanos chanos TaxID=29144 RepID=A0A6J2W6S1_CHACN|nr:brain natriuretic peptide-like [Chanos chanos]